MSKLATNFDEFYSMVNSECDRRIQEIENKILELKEANKLASSEVREEIDSLQKQINNLL